MPKILVLYSPCLAHPYYVLDKPFPEEFDRALEWARLTREYKEKNVIFHPFLCAETILLGYPRPALDKESYKQIGIDKVIDQVVLPNIEDTIAYLKPDYIIFVGIKRSPTCGVNYTTKGLVLKEFFKRWTFDEYRKLPFKVRKQEWLKQFRSLTVEVNEPGSLFEKLKKKYPNAYFIEIDKINYKKSVEELKRIINELLTK